jgi:hypothetical protein
MDVHLFPAVQKDDNLSTASLLLIDGNGTAVELYCFLGQTQPKAGAIDLGGEKRLGNSLLMHLPNPDP